MYRARTARRRWFDSLPSLSDPRFIPQKKAEVSKRQYSSNAKSSNVHDFLPIKNTVREQETPDGRFKTAVPLSSIRSDNGLAYGSRLFSIYLLMYYCIVHA